MLDASGVWKVSYIATDDGREEGPAPEEIAVLRLGEDGSVTGNDPFGGKYSGSYSVEGTLLKASVTVEKNYDEAITIFQNFDYPLRVELEGNYTSPDVFTANCTVNGSPNLLVSCKRIADLI